MNVLALLALILLGLPEPAPEPAEIPAGLRCLVAAYPETVCGASATELRLCDGTVLPWDDGRDLPVGDEGLDDADLRDQMAQPYPVGRERGVPPARGADPGRARHGPLFTAMYGADRAAVRAKTRVVRWLPKTADVALRFATVNGAATALEAVSSELEGLPPEIRRHAEKPAGTFVWRNIRGTNRPSVHSFAIAIDLDVSGSDYWRWARPGADGLLRWRNRFPWEIVEVFERHGFIWGGKWYHFDTMHFEYRPELLQAGCVDR
ncbi:MAG: M15 family metallopeptidase [Myxococcota bacterium]